MKPKDLLQIVLLAALIWFTVIAPRLDKPTPPIITAGPTVAGLIATQPAPVVIELQPSNLDAMNTAAAGTLQAIPQPAALQPPTATPGPSLNEVIGQPDGSNPFGGSITLIP